MKIMEWVKAHPKTTVVLVVGGGLTFILLSGWFTKGSATTTVGSVSGGPSDTASAAAAAIQQAQLAAGVANNQTNAQVQIATIQAQYGAKEAELEAALGAQNIGATLQATLAQIAASAQMYSVGADVDKYSTGANKDIQLAIIDALKPQTAAPSSGYAAFDPYNTSNTSQPILQGYDADIATKIDKGIIKVDNGLVYIGGDANSAGGSYAFSNPLDARWDNYIAGSYSGGQGIQFGG